MRENFSERHQENDARQSQGDEAWAEPPTSTDEIIALFDAVRAGADGGATYRLMAQRAHQAIEQRLMSQYGHEKPVDWYDHPAATILAGGMAASERLANADPEHTRPTNNRMRDWHKTLNAYAFCNDTETSNRIFRDVQLYGQYQDTTAILSQ